MKRRRMPGAGSQAAAVGDGRRWMRRVALTVVILAVAVGTVVGIRPGRRPAEATDIAQVVEIHSAHGASFIPALQGKRPLFILALGSDARPGEPLERERSDSIHIIGVNPAAHTATVLGFPRDSWVPIPGFGTSKINTAMSDGGPPLMVRTLEDLTGIRIDFWVLTSFQGMSAMVDGIGGLTVRVTQPMHDPLSGSNFEPGLRHLTGRQALAFARDRHSFLRGDLARSGNQGRLLLAAQAKLRGILTRTPAALFTWMAVGWRNFHTDLSPATLLQLALTAAQVRRVNNLVVPATGGTVGSASVVFISPAASSLFADMRADGVARLSS
jgi:LCP family protein required for cell wall assembly